VKVRFGDDIVGRGCFVVAGNLLYIWSDIGCTPSNSLMSVLEDPLRFICIGYHWESSQLCDNAEKQSNSELVVIIV
jgi:hypothetical protein